MQEINKENLFNHLFWIFEESELKYINKSIEFIIDNYEKMFEKFEREYLSKKKKLQQNKKYYKIIDQIGNTIGDYHEELAIDKVIEYEKNSEILISSIWIKQVAYIENLLNLLAEFSYEIFKCKIKPNDFYGKKYNTDCIKSVKYIKLISNSKFDIEKNSKIYKKFLLLREIRHRLAHGKNIFILDISFLRK